MHVFICLCYSVLTFGLQNLFRGYFRHFLVKVYAYIYLRKISKKSSVQNCEQRGFPEKSINKSKVLNFLRYSFEFFQPSIKKLISKLHFNFSLKFFIISRVICPLYFSYISLLKSVIFQKVFRLGNGFKPFLVE